MTPAVPTEEQDRLQWVHIDDFSPGIWSNTHVAIEHPAVSAPVGAANPANTWGCASLPGGGLGPLPGVWQSEFYSGRLPGSATSAVQTGFICNPGLINNNDELITLIEADDGVHHFAQGYSFQYPSAVVNSILNNSSNTTPGYFGAPYPAWTRMSVGGSSPWPPVLVFPGAVVTDASGTNGHLYVYPPLLSPTSYSVQDLIVAGSSVTGQVIAYGSRVIVLAGISYSHPGASINTNENVNFTDPPLSSTYGNQQEILGAEIPWGYGAWGTVSVGELLLVKKVGGALIVYGDIQNPTSVVPVQGVAPTGNFVGSAAATPSGLYYCSQDRGAWLWNGGNSAQKISGHIADDFFDLGVQNALGTNNYGFFCYPWQKWVMFSNNYAYDSETGAWWIWFPQTSQTTGINGSFGQQLYYYSQSAAGNRLYAAPLTLVNNQIWFTLFDDTIAQSTWSWESVPIHVVDHADRQIDVREIVLRLSSPDNDPTDVAQVSIGSFSATTTEVIGPNPTPIRLNVGGQGATGSIQDITITVIGYNTNLNSAPVLHSIDIGYQVRQREAVNN